MNDRRLLPANGRVAASELRGMVASERFVDGTWHRIARPVVDLLDAPEGRRERQLLFGQRIRLLESRDGLAFVQTVHDGYVGYIPADACSADARPTHRVAAAATHLYSQPDLKSPEICWLSHGSQLTITGKARGWLQTDAGHFVHPGHLAELTAPPADPVDTAKLFLGTPYLWGGNSRAGIDCSGLVQAALLAAGLSCPADSDQQQEAVGTCLPGNTSPRRGDLFFWKGHVAMAVDATTLIHANAFHMAVAFEPIDAALARIARNEFGALTAHKRVSPSEPDRPAG